MGKTIDGITRTASSLTGTERFALRDGTPDPTDPLDAKATISQITDLAITETISDITSNTTVSDYVFSEVDNLASQATIEDANLFVLRDGSDSKSITGSALILSCKDSDYPSYKNLVVKNTVASPNNQIDITFDNLQIGRIHKTNGSYLAFNVETAGNWDTGTAAEPTNGWIYVWMMAKIDGTVNPFYSLSATSPTMPSGYVYKRLSGVVRNTSGNFINFYQTNDIIQVDLLNIATNYNPGTSLVALNCSAFYPAAITSMARLNVEMGGASGNYVTSPTSTGLGQVYNVVGTSSVGSQHDVFVTSENIYFRYSGSSSSRFLVIAISAYQIKI